MPRLRISSIVPSSAICLDELTCTSKLRAVVTCNLCSQGNSPHRNAVWNVGHGGCIWFILLCNKCEEICYKVQEGAPNFQHPHGVGWRIFHRVHVGISTSVPPWYSVTNNGYVATLMYLLDQIQLLSYQILTSSITGLCTLCIFTWHIRWYKKAALWLDYLICCSVQLIPSL